MEFLVQLVIVLGLPGLALITGRICEKRHFRSIIAREAELSEIPITNLKKPSGNIIAANGAQLVFGQVVITGDYLKNFLSGLRKIFGGELKSYKSLMERAEREAIIRMTEQAKINGYNAVCNVKIDFSNIGGMRNNNIISVEVLASGTAYCTQK